MGDRGGRSCVEETGCFLRGMIGVPSIDSLSKEDELASSLFLVKETIHSLSPNLGLDLVALALMLLGMA